MSDCLTKILEWLDPDWFQAIGSIVAVAAGFGYVVFQNHLARKHALEIRIEHQAHAILAIEATLIYQRNVIEVFEHAVATDGGIQNNFGPAIADAYADELVALSVADLGSATIVSGVRKAGLYSRAFNNVARMCETKELEADDVTKLKNTHRVVSETLELLSEEIGHTGKEDRAKRRYFGLDD